MEIGFFSTDFTKEPVVDEVATQLTGQRQFKKGVERLQYGGTFYMRGALPATEMANHGFDTHLAWQFQVAPDGHLRTLDMHGEWHDPDVVYQQRWMHEDAASQFQRARATGQKIVGDVDDDFWSLTKTNVAYYTTDPVKNPTFNRDHYWNGLGACDAITVSTESLRKRVARLNVPTFVVRNAIDMTQWEQNDPGEDGFISWIGGIQWRSHDLHQLRCANLAKFLFDQGLGMYHGGDSRVPGVPKFYEQIGIDPTQIKCAVAPLCPIWDYPKLWAPVNVSLVPLERCAFNYAKSWLKALESCAAGVPYIVSAKFPEQDLLIAEGTAGRVARNDKPAQWIAHLTELLDPDVRRAEGKINRSVAERHDIRLRWTDWAEVYEQIAA